MARPVRAARVWVPTPRSRVESSFHPRVHIAARGPGGRWSCGLRMARPSPTPCRVCYRLCVINSLTSGKNISWLPRSTVKGMYPHGRPKISENVSLLLRKFRKATRHPKISERRHPEKLRENRRVRREFVDAHERAETPSPALALPLLICPSRASRCALSSSPGPVASWRCSRTPVGPYDPALGLPAPIAQR